MGLFDRFNSSYSNNINKSKIMVNRQWPRIISVALILILSANSCLCKNLTNEARVKNGLATDPLTYNFYDVSETTVEPSFAQNRTVVKKNSPAFSTGNTLWDNVIKECLRKPTFSCIQKNVYSYLDEQLNTDDFNVTNRLLFFKNRVDFTKYTKEANLKHNTVDDDDSEEEGRAETPIEEVTHALYGKGVKFVMTHDVEVKMPDVMFDGATFKISPRSIEGNGIIAKLEFIPKSVIESRGVATPRIFLKKIKKFFKNKLLLAFLAIILVVKLIKIKVFWLLPIIVGVGAAKKLALKFLLFLFPALAHIFKLCSYYHSTYHKTNFHHHRHHINHLHTVGSDIVPSFEDEHHGPPAHINGPYGGHGPSKGYNSIPEIIYTKPPRGHPSEYIHGAPVPPHQHFQPDWELSGPGLGSEYISGISRISQSDTFKPKADDINDINTWGLGGDAHAQSSLQSYNVNPLLTDPTRSGSKHNSGPVYPGPVYAPTSQKILQSASKIAAQYAPPSVEDQTRLQQQQEAFRIQREKQLIAKQQQILHQQPFVSDVQQNLQRATVDHFYSPILDRLDKVFNQLGFQDEVCRERLVCSMYKNPQRYSPHSNFVSAELSRDANELQKPTAANIAVVRFYRYVQAARDGQENNDCLRIYSACSINTER